MPSLSRLFGYILGIFILLHVVCGARVLPPLVGFVKTSNTQFVLNGSPFLFNGFNAYWMMHVAVDPSQRYKVSQVFRDASAVGLTVCRTWAFSDGGDQALQLSPGVYNERVFQALDFVVSEAQKYDIRLVVSLVNNYNDYGGRPQYTQWAKNAGVPVSSDDDFYTHPVLKNYYKNHVKSILTRVNTITKMAYKEDPTIMAWELMNEPRCQADLSGRTLNGWVQEMATYTKSIDNKHMLEIGMEGFYGDSIPDRDQFNPGYKVGTDFISNNLIREIDFSTIHAYPDIWLKGQNEDAQVNFVNRWMSSHWADSKTVIQKPVVFTEFGKSSKDPAYSLSERDSFLNDVYDNIYDDAKSGGAFGGGFVWQLLAEGMNEYDDGYGIVLSQNPTTAAVISAQSQKMNSLNQ
ncbi:mannan endo-1,4-beta-mannosidase [Ranunculus cassubicifolius]